MDKNTVISLSKVTKSYKLYLKKSHWIFDALSPFNKRNYRSFEALKKIDMNVQRGEILGVVGRNGSGKSTLLKIAAGISAPTSGYVTIRGNVVPIIELGAGFHQDLTGRENLYYYITLQGYPKKKGYEIMEQIIDFAELGEFIDQPLRTYSRGMRSRIAFAASLYVDPDILVVDEVLAVGDEYFKKKSMDKMHELFNSGKTMIYVTHNGNDVKKFCTRAIMLNKGELIIDGKPDEVVKHYQEYFKQKQSDNPKNKI